MLSFFIGRIILYTNKNLTLSKLKNRMTSWKESLKMMNVEPSYGIEPTFECGCPVTSALSLPLNVEPCFGIESVHMICHDLPSEKRKLSN